MGLTLEQEQILAEIQINSYNIDQKFQALNEEILKDTEEKTLYQNISTISSTLNLLSAVILIYVILNLVKIRGEKR